MIRNRAPIWIGVACLAASMLGVAGTSGDDGAGIVKPGPIEPGPIEPGRIEPDTEQTDAAPGLEPVAGAVGELSLEAARDRATVMQDVYVATLDMLHQRYFHRDRSLLPARAMHDIFDQLERKTQVRAKWISASLPPMSNDHKPEGEFEKLAAKEITAGISQLETLEDGYYRRAVAVPLGGGCVGCHQGLARNPNKKHFVGLIVSIPLQPDAGP